MLSLLHIKKCLPRIIVKGDSVWVAFNEQEVLLTDSFEAKDWTAVFKSFKEKYPHVYKVHVDVQQPLYLVKEVTFPHVKAHVLRQMLYFESQDKAYKIVFKKKQAHVYTFYECSQSFLQSLVKAATLQNIYIEGVYPAEDRSLSFTDDSLLYSQRRFSQQIIAMVSVLAILAGSFLFAYFHKRVFLNEEACVESLRRACDTYQYRVRELALSQSKAKVVQENIQRYQACRQNLNDWIMFFSTLQAAWAYLPNSWIHTLSIEGETIYLSGRFALDEKYAGIDHSFDLFVSALESAPHVFTVRKGQLTGNHAFECILNVTEGLI